MCRFSDLQENILSHYRVLVLSQSVLEMSFYKAFMCFSCFESGLYKDMIDTDGLF